MSPDTPLVLVSNRGPATFEPDDAGELKPSRGGGGLVTALKGLVDHRDALWIASTLTEGDSEMSRRSGGRSFSCEVDETTYRLRLVDSDPEGARALGRNGKEHVRRKFLTPRYLRDYLRIFHEAS